MTSSEAPGQPGAPNGEPPDAASGAAPPVAVVACHGDLAAGLVSAVAQITGQGGRLVSLSNRGRGPAELEAALREALAASPIRAVFTDLPGGSCTMAARRVQRERPELAVATGVNLAALLEFVCAAGDVVPDAEAAGANVAKALDRGRASIVAFGGTPAAASASGTQAG